MLDRAMMPGRGRFEMFKTAQDAAEFTTAGNATLTLRSAKTGKRFTYKVRAPKDRNAGQRFVSLLTGADNTSDYTYLGLLTATGEFRMTRASRMASDSLPVVAFGFFAKKVLIEGSLPEALEVRHEGHCGRCGRALTVPESIDRGIGPECIKHVH